MAELIHGDCLEVLRGMPDNLVDAIITDPPYGLSFMGKKWDYDVPSVEVWRECLRVLKPGGHLLSFAGSRTYHRMAVNVEDAGFEIRDQIMWVYGSGFPKSQNISKAIDKAAGAEREVIGSYQTGEGAAFKHSGNGTPQQHLAKAKEIKITIPTTPEAKQWKGWGSALKPAHEPIVVARKSLIGTIVENVLEHGTGGLNIDESRTEDGRFPANFIHDGSDEVVSLFPDSKAGKPRDDRGTGGMFSDGNGIPCAAQYGDDGSAARFFYSAKASTSERGEENIHPTVKPIDLMRYLCRLITPPNGIVLDPFMGSGTTGIAAEEEGFAFIGIEREEEYLRIAEVRIERGIHEVVEQECYKDLSDWL